MEERIRVVIASIAYRDRPSFLPLRVSESPPCSQPGQGDATYSDAPGLAGFRTQPEFSRHGSILADPTQAANNTGPLQVGPECWLHWGFRPKAAGLGRSAPHLALLGGAFLFSEQARGPS